MNSTILKFSLLLLILSTCTTTAYTYGILRTPGDFGDDILCPLVCVDVNVEIHEQVAITTVRNSFFNETDEAIRATYHYRLPAEASVNGFGLWRGADDVSIVLWPMAG